MNTCPQSKNKPAICAMLEVNRAQIRSSQTLVHGWSIKRFSQCLVFDIWPEHMSHSAIHRTVKTDKTINAKVLPKSARSSRRLVQTQIKLAQKRNSISIPKSKNE